MIDHLVQWAVNGVDDLDDVSKCQRGQGRTMKVEAEEITDRICLDLDGTECLLLETPGKYDSSKYGVASSGHVLLTMEDAEDLIRDLQSAVDRIRLWYRYLDEYSDAVETFAKFVGCDGQKIAEIKEHMRNWKGESPPEGWEDDE